LYDGANAEIYDTVFHSNTANSVSNSQIVPRNLLETFVPIPGGPHTFFLQMSSTPSIWLGLRQNLVQTVSLGLRFHLHYFSAPSELFLRKELSQIFALIPGGPHATSRVGLFMLLVMQMSRSTPAHSSATAPPTV
jgi:hypothetical protein